jgi:Tfp pilus assembly protein PilE
MTIRFTFSLSRGQPVRPPRDFGRGTTLVEVLVASAVMAILMVGVLQVFSVSLLTSQGAAARTDLTYRAQQVVENLRMIQYFAKSGNWTPAQLAGLGATPNPSSTKSFYSIPTTGATAISNTNAFWIAAGVVTGPSDPFRISYSVVDLTGTPGEPPWATGYYSVVVTAAPVNAPGATIPSGAAFYSGSNSADGSVQSVNIKQVTYVAQIPQ